MSEKRPRLPYLKAFGDWLVRFQRLDDAQFGRLIRAAIAYVCAGEVPAIDGMEGLSFDYLRPALDDDMARYAAKVQKNTENGLKGAASRWGADSERHTQNSETPLVHSENSQEKREKKEERREKSEEQRVKGADNAEQEALSTAWSSYLEMRESLGKPFQESAEIGSTLEQLQAIGNGDLRTMTAILNNAIKDRRAELLPLAPENVSSIVRRIASVCSR